ncbi:hypothetical protein Hdeb2414_s0019g00546591 [Helianthus debilis subsp. tardiflorus]
MKRSKVTNPIKPCKKLKSGIASPDPSKEVNNQSVGQTVDKTKRLLRGRKTPAKQDKSVDSRGLKAFLKGAGDLTLTTNANTVKGNRVTENIPSTTADVQDYETNGNSSTIGKWGKTFKRQPTNRKTSVALSNQNEDASVKKQKEKSNTPAKGKRGSMISLSIESSPQGKKPSGNSNIPLSITNGDDQKPSFEKSSSFWETIGSMEAFRLFPQNPHFRPLDTLNESARERRAIYKMVDFLGVFENMCRLRCDHPRTEFQDQLEILLELESHGFDVDSLRIRLMEMLSLKDKQEALETGSKVPKDHLEIECVKVEERKIDIMLIDSQIDELRNKRERLLKENEQSTMNIAAWEKEVAEIEEAKCDYDRKFYELATAPY